MCIFIISVNPYRMYYIDCLMLWIICADRIIENSHVFICYIKPGPLDLIVRGREKTSHAGKNKKVRNLLTSGSIKPLRLKNGFVLYCGQICTWEYIFNLILPSSSSQTLYQHHHYHYECHLIRKNSSFRDSFYDLLYQNKGT